LSEERRERPSRAEKKKSKTEFIEARITAIERISTGQFAFRLDGGQIWIQLESSRHEPFQAGDTVRIRKAALGSYLASLPDSGSAIRVRRYE
jgi:membrane protein implicated in regulation of membrane protease activity